MTLSSMTGFSRQVGGKSFDKASFSWVWEIKSVNGKGLDIKTKLPSWLDGEMSLALKNSAAKFFNRGSVSVYLDLKSENLQSEIRINDTLLNLLAVKAIGLQESFGDKLQKASSAELLAFHGVVETSEEELSEDERQILEQDLLADFEAACRKLQKDRRSEGEKMQQALLDIINKVATITKDIETVAISQPHKLKERLLQQVSELLDVVPVDEERLAQEFALYVARADIREEIDRLNAHIKTAKQLLNSDEAVGRRLDFLCQELNREANTTCSKSFSIEQTNLGMELKTLIEQFREQVQNIE